MKKYFYNTSWILLERVVRVALNLFIWGRIAHELGASNFGIFAYFQAIIFILIPLSSLGVDQIIRKKISLIPEKASQYISAGIQIKLISSFLICFIGILAALLSNFRFENNPLIFICFLVGLIFRTFGIIEYYFDWKLESRLNGVIRTFSFLVISVLYIVALIYELPLYWFALIFSFEFLLISISLILAFKSEGETISFAIYPHLIKDLLHESFPILLCDLAVCIFLRVNQVLLGGMISSVSVGVYSAATRFSECWYFIPSSLLVSYFSLLTFTHEDSKIKFNKYAGFLFELTLVIAIAIALFTYSFSSKLILFFYGSSYLETSSILNILIISNIFMFWGIVQEPIDVAKDILYWRFFRVSTGAILSLFSGYFLIDLFGASGAAWSVVLTFFWTYFLSNLFYSKGRPIFFIQLRSFLFIELFRFLKRRIYKKSGEPFYLEESSE